ncbi:MAG: LysR family transcriptional regulator [Methyloligellaceae bacterium]
MDLQEMRVFARVASLQSLSAAAVDLGMTPGNVSKRLQGLEDSLGVRLFDRSTRKIRITEEGEILLKYVSRVLRDVDDAESAVRCSGLIPKGTLHVSAPASLGRRHIRPGICEFLRLYPDVSVDLNLTDKLVNLIDEGFDVAIRTGALPDSQLIAKRLAPDEYFILAAPSYLKKNGEPQTPQDLAKCNCLVLNEHSQWTLSKDGNQVSVRVSGTLTSDSAEMVHAAALSGLGIIRTSLLKAHDDIDAGRLVRVLPAFDVAGTAAIWAIYTSSRHVPPKLRVFLDFFAERFQKIRTTSSPALVAKKSGEKTLPAANIVHLDASR